MQCFFTTVWAAEGDPAWDEVPDAHPQEQASHGREKGVYRLMIPVQSL